jgi:citrate lyase subunit beta/citryl-CoA lyase
MPVPVRARRSVLYMPAANSRALEKSRDDAGFVRSCRRGRELGFDGKTLIHPKTIALANAAFVPSPEEVAWSRRVIAAHDAVAQDGKGIVLVDGKLVENLHVANARRLVALAAAIEERTDSAATR